MTWPDEAARSRRFPPLNDDLRRQLETIPPSEGLYRPCGAVLDDGTRLDRVYVAEAHAWYTAWGIWPDEDRGKKGLDVRRVRSVFESPDRLPPEGAASLYEAGESGMGYLLFKVLFRDGTSATFVTGNAVDFIRYPPGQSAATVTGVVPHEGRHDPCLTNAPDFYWCLYSDG